MCGVRLGWGRGRRRVGLCPWVTKREMAREIAPGQWKAVAVGAPFWFVSRCVLVVELDGTVSFDLGAISVTGG